MSVNISTKKGEAKAPVERATLRDGFGIEGDVHAGSGIKQVSLLAWESVERQLVQLRELGVTCPKKHGLTHAGSDEEEYTLHPGDYAENLTLKGIDLAAVSIGDTLKIGGEIVLEVTAIGKECHQHCAVYKRLGDCVMPREGVFTKVIRGGPIAAGDEVSVVKP
jgi:hypothetical protein